MKDPQIREVLRKTVLQHYFSDPDSRVVEELRLSPAPAQVDIAIINGAFHAYEIKSSSDTLNRLPKQIESYIKIFDYINVVTEEKYEKQVAAIVPGCVGISICYADNVCDSRLATRNYQTEGFYVAQLLWRDELVAVLNQYGIAFKSYHRNWILCEMVAEQIDKAILCESVAFILKQRISWKLNYSSASCGDSNLSPPMSPGSQS